MLQIRMLRVSAFEASLQYMVDTLPSQMKTCSARSTVSQRISKAVAASKHWKPVFNHSALPCKWKLCKWKLIVYRSIVMSILAYGMESCNQSPSQQRVADSLDCKKLLGIFRKKFSHYHRVVAPSDVPCSDEYLTKLANSATHTTA